MAAIETDYLVIGGGGSAMAFVDTLLSEAPDAQVLMVDATIGPAATGTMRIPSCGCTSRRRGTAWPRAS